MKIAMSLTKNQWYLAVVLGGAAILAALIRFTPDTQLSAREAAIPEAAVVTLQSQDETELLTFLNSFAQPVNTVVNTVSQQDPYLAGGELVGAYSVVLLGTYQVNSQRYANLLFIDKEKSQREFKHLRAGEQYHAIEVAAVSSTQATLSFAAQTVTLQLFKVNNDNHIN